MIIAVDTRLLLKGKLTGIGHYTHEVLKILVKSHPEHQFIFVFDRPWDTDFIFADNITPIKVFPQARATPLIHLWFQYQVPKALKPFKPDVFLSLEHYIPLTLDYPSILTIHDLAFEHFPQTNRWMDRAYYTRMTQKFVNQASAIITVSESTKQDIIATYKTDASKITIAPPAVRKGMPQVFGEPPSEEIKFLTEKPFFFHLGTIEPRKNIANLLLAFDRFKSSTGADTKLLFSGSRGWKDAHIYQTFESLLHKSDVHFLGYTEEWEIQYLLDHALALVYVSIFEGFGMPVIEAQSRNCPVITSDVSSLPEAAGKGALFIDPFSIESISDGMQKIFYDENLRRQLRLDGSENVLRFSWEKTSNQVFDVIDRLFN